MRVKSRLTWSLFSKEGIAMSTLSTHQVVTHTGAIVQDPPFVTKFLSDPRAGWLFLPLRVWLGYQWVDASLHKLSNPAWVVTGDALKGFWTNAVAISATTGKG